MRMDHNQLDAAETTELSTSLFRLVLWEVRNHALLCVTGQHLARLHVVPCHVFEVCDISVSVRAGQVLPVHAGRLANLLPLNPVRPTLLFQGPAVNRDDDPGTLVEREPE